MDKKRLELSNAKDSWKEAWEWTKELAKWTGEVVKWTSKALWNVFMWTVEIWAAWAYKLSELTTKDPARKNLMSSKVQHHKKKSKQYLSNVKWRAVETVWWAGRLAGWALTTGGYAAKASYHLADAWYHVWKEAAIKKVNKVKAKKQSKKKTNP